MIVYFDTSALVKLFVKETSSELARRYFEGSETAVTHLIAYVEAHAAVSRLQRSRVLSADRIKQVRSNFEAYWPTFSVMGLDDVLAQDAAELTGRFPLRAYDSIHLAAALRLRTQTQMPVTFGCFDRRLNRIASGVRVRTLSNALAYSYKRPRRSCSVNPRNGASIPRPSAITL